MTVFYDTKTGLILENVTPDGQFSDSFEGRLLNPGHAIEAMWFIMDLGEDDGVTWSQPINITPSVKNPSWRLFFQGPSSERLCCV